MEFSEEWGRPLSTRRAASKTRQRDMGGPCWWSGTPCLLSGGTVGQVEACQGREEGGEGGRRRAAGKEKSEGEGGGLLGQKGIGEFQAAAGSRTERKKGGFLSF